MTSRSWTVVWALAAALFLGLAPIQAQDEQAGGMSPEQAAEMAAWMKAGTPGEHHQHLNDLVGNWNCAVKFWNPGSDEAMESSGKSSSEWILDGRYTIDSYKGDFMGMPFEGRGICGYDNINKRYFSIWMDSMSTGYMTETGQYDAGSKTFTFTGSFDTPTGGTMQSKSTIKVVSKDQHVLTMWHGESPGSLNKVMEITYNRAGSAASAATAGAKLAGRTIELGCAMCSYHMSGAKGCALAAKVDGKTIMVKGGGISDDEMHRRGLCGGTKMAKVDGQLTDAELIATSVSFLP